ncbi:hypothetical protein EVAR_44445_1 [Eumeta japonica]|uniref:Uncharacterized protein n=1 Tax=Eumeta variegata TaxID=151549 RepID=A0A4C1WKU3_EUMVA|nr:hypothetical protein EVAR_44445_1 [Eumeta japonica]
MHEVSGHAARNRARQEDVHPWHSRYWSSAYSTDAITHLLLNGVRHTDLHARRCSCARSSTAIMRPGDMPLSYTEHVIRSRAARGLLYFDASVQ